MSRLLAIETSSEACSAALLGRDGELLAARAEHAPRQHARLILPMIDEILAEQGLDMADLTALAYGHGPGAFTGVRIAAGLSMGLADGLGVPLFGVSCLHSMALQAERVSGQSGSVLVATDARMGEVYWGWFEQGSAAAREEHVTEPDALLARGFEPTLLIGDAAARVEAIAPIAEQAAWADTSAMPLAEDVAQLAWQRWQQGERPEPVSQQPVYLRDRVADPAARV
jgi:tRNA threonylcarbamoyladenosine biosynthesis protein TsaB